MLLLDFGNKLACTFFCDGSNARLFLFELRPDLNKKDCPLVKLAQTDKTTDPLIGAYVQLAELFPSQISISYMLTEKLPLVFS